MQQVGQPSVYYGAARKRRAVIDSRPDQRMTEMYPGDIHAYQACFFSRGEQRRVEPKSGPGNSVAIGAVGCRGEQKGVPGPRWQLSQAGGEHRAEPVGQR